MLKTHLQELEVQEFIDFTQTEPDMWKCYCEILITKEGKVILARPSHQIALLNYEADMQGRDLDIVVDEFPYTAAPESYVVDKRQIIAVWYTAVLVSSNGISDSQKETLDKLVYYNLIHDQYRTDETNEYHLFQEREKMGVHDSTLGEMKKMLSSVEWRNINE